MTPSPWADWILERMDDQPCALISLLAVEGSTPREAGVRMALSASGEVFGTIGGGNFEYQAMEQARRILGLPPGAWRIQDYPLGPLLGQCCGGRVRTLIEHVGPAQRPWLEAMRDPPPFPGLRTELAQDGLRRAFMDLAPGPLSARGAAPQVGDVLSESLAPPLPPVALFGAGHVGEALARILEDLPFRLSWFDEREDSPPGVFVADRATLCAEARAARGYVLILTHDHALDYELLRAALGSRARFIGLIGSATKRTRFFRRLRDEGFPDEDLARVVCPIGLPEVKGKAPAVVAVSVAAQLLSLESGKS
ncbi:xanthine dehydrogenase accessory protein XdhC [Neomegalonema sp.]|uniref:xanthine dehydrogenase accessory protein XdhC n=1 Tax=Neomegalonema sp. TaxID=2039713 RepID=UPI00261EA8EB|nr:xanthine dehydrogenase accessory protein XdhC [Neomegalonema sp.]MDD2868575.1 xanthine dehydrogenase accessory protein XdhC [Neomegalonema sp.]